MYKAAAICNREIPSYLHGSHGEFGNGHHVQLGQWVRHSEEIVVGVQDLEGTVESKLSGRRLAGWRVYLDEYSMVRLALDKVEFSDTVG